MRLQFGLRIFSSDDIPKGLIWLGNQSLKTYMSDWAQFGLHISGVGECAEWALSYHYSPMEGVVAYILIGGYPVAALHRISRIPHIRLPYPNTGGSVLVRDDVVAQVGQAFPLPRGTLMTLSKKASYFEVQVLTDSSKKGT
jgi:hypothetical protein